MADKALLPRKSESKRIQREHRRRILTRDGYRNIRINKGVEKSLMRSAVRNSSVGKLRPKIKSQKSFTLSKPKTSKGITLKPRDPRRNWKKLFKLDYGPSELELKKKEIERKIEREGIKLLTGEKVAIQVAGLGQVGGMMSTMGSVELYDKDEGARSIPMEWRMSSGRLIEWLREQAEQGNPIIYKENQYGLLDLLEYARPLEKVDLREGAIDSEYKGGYFSTRVSNEGDHVIVEKVNPNTGKVKSKRFDDMTEYFLAEEKASELDYDVFGDRIYPQRTLDEYSYKEPITIMKGWMPSNTFREYQIDKLPNGKFIAYVTNHLDLFEHCLTRQFNNPIEAIEYIERFKKGGKKKK